MGAKDWSLEASQGMPNISDAWSMSHRLYKKSASCCEQSDWHERAWIGNEQFSLNSSMRPSVVLAPANHRRLPDCFMLLDLGMPLVQSAHMML